MAKCFQCLRVLVIIFNVLFVLVGLAILGCSIWLYVDQTVRDMKGAADPNAANMIDIILFVAMGIGAVTVIVGMFGCCGAYHDSECLLGTYFFCLLLILGAEVAGGVVLFIFKDKQLVEKGLRESMKSSIKKYIDSSNDEEPLPVQLKSIQNWFNCCGADGVEDYVRYDSVDLYNKNKKFVRACGEYKASTTSLFPELQALKPGCVKTINKMMNDNAIYILIVCCGIAFLELIAMIVAISLCCSVRRLDAGYVGVST